MSGLPAIGMGVGACRDARRPLGLVPARLLVPACATPAHPSAGCPSHCLVTLPTTRCREAKARASGTQQGDRDFLEAACRFLPACTERQVRMAPDKCACAMALRSELPGSPWAARLLTMVHTCCCAASQPCAA